LAIAAWGQGYSDKQAEKLRKERLRKEVCKAIRAFHKFPFILAEWRRPHAWPELNRCSGKA
jgi:hypothetical protein